MLSMALVVPVAEAQGRRDRNGGRASSSATHNSSRGGNRSQGGSSRSESRNNNGGYRGNSRPGQSQGSVNNGNNRPGNHRPDHNQGTVNNGNNRPGNHRPGHNQGTVNNGNNRPGNRRPGHDQGNYGRPNYGGNHRPDSRPDHRPPVGNHYSYEPRGHHHGHGPGIRPPHNAPLPYYRPVYHHPWVRPVPPRAWRPGPRVPVFSTILGITFGIGVNATLDYLVNNSYTIYAYNNNEVYLNNVRQLNLLWPDATLYYSGGRLDRGDFIYSTGYYDTSRYNLTYSRLINAYGNPISTTYPDNGLQTTWYGPDGRFVTLTYQPLYGADGIYRYYTTLSFGM